MKTFIGCAVVLTALIGFSVATVNAQTPCDPRAGACGPPPSTTIPPLAGGPMPEPIAQVAPTPDEDATTVPVQHNETDTPSFSINETASVGLVPIDSESNAVLAEPSTPAQAERVPVPTPAPVVTPPPPPAPIQLPVGPDPTDQPPGSEIKVDPSIMYSIDSGSIIAFR